MINHIVPPEISQKLNSLGYDTPAIGFFNIRGVFIPDFNVSREDLIKTKVPNINLAPLYNQVLDWAQEKYNIIGYIVPAYQKENCPFSFVIGRVHHTEVCFATREEAYIACIMEIIQIIEGIDN